MGRERKARRYRKKWKDFGPWRMSQAEVEAKGINSSRVATPRLRVALDHTWTADNDAPWTAPISDGRYRLGRHAVYTVRRRGFEFPESPFRFRILSG
jgi:hypothetical protein